MFLKKAPKLILGLILTAPSAIAASKPVGLTLQARGEPQLRRGGEQSPLRIGDSLFSGDVLTAGEGEVVFLFCPTTEALTLRSGGVAELTDTSVTLLEGSQLGRVTVRRCALPQVALGSESLERVGGLRARGFPPIPIFLGGAVSTTRPVFEWAALEGGPQYQVVLKNSLGAVIWEGGTAETRLPYPASEPELEAASYFWQVTAVKDGQTLGQQGVRFEVKPDAEFAAGAAEDDAARLVLAAALENAGYYSEAAALYRMLRRSHPEDERFTSRLAWLYWNAGLFIAAGEERKKLEKES